MNRFTAAPQAKDFNALFLQWKKSYPGGFNKFYEFMTTPSVERDVFLARFETEIKFKGNICVLTVKI